MSVFCYIDTSYCSTLTKRGGMCSPTLTHTHSYFYLQLFVCCLKAWSWIRQCYAQHVLRKKAVSTPAHLEEKKTKTTKQTKPTKQQQQQKKTLDL